MTTGVRTYRYLRLTIVGSVVLLAGAVVWLCVTGDVPESISAVYYTPVGGVFVGSLVAVALGLVSLSGRSVRRPLLALAAMAAPFVAFVPTPLSSSEVQALSGRPCAGGEGFCLPSGASDAAVGSVVALLVVEALGLACAALVLRTELRATPSNGSGWRALWPLVVGILLLAAYAVSVLVARHLFLRTAHYLSATVFFLLIVIIAVSRALEVRRLETIEAPGRPIVYTVLYLVCAIVMTVDVLVLVTLWIVDGMLHDVHSVFGRNWVLVLESGALVPFTVFWFAQTIETWRTRSPRGLLADRVAEPEGVEDP